ncbi:MAG TPA: lytic transglycosylase domain-containing protein [Rhizomicrobium sp.]|nr:lytic transglycosylase domain-containing protein [Rhizomicrobium sp.]
MSAMDLKHIGIAFAALLAGGAMAAGQTRTPAVPPGAAVVIEPRPDAGTTRSSNLHILSASDHDLFARAFAAAAKSDWVTAMALGNQGQDAVARQLLQWRYTLDRDSGAKFTDIDAALKMATGWPLRGSLYARAEAAITPDMSREEIVQWFGARTPASPTGRIRLGEALVARGEKTQGGALIRQGWSEGSFDDFTEAGILSADGAYLTPEADRARLDTLLWRGEVIDAKRQMKRVDSKSRAVAEARIALASGYAKARTALAKVAGSNDPALLFDWARALRLADKDKAAHAMLLRIEPAALARDHTQRWWNEVAVQARDALAAGDPRLALRLAEHAGIPPGEQFVEQQFLGGFIELRFLKEPEKALAWFQRLSANVSRPISKSRAEYWQGRALEAMGEPGGAYAHYRVAATFPDTFYGQLAMARTEAQPVLHLNDSPAVPLARSAIENDTLMPQIKVLAELGQTNDLRLFAVKEAELYPAPAHLRQFLQTLTDWGYRDVALRLAKNSGYAGQPMLGFAYPVLGLPAYAGSGPGPQAALVHALIRQETEFDAQAISSAGARGLMQIMLSAAKTSSKIGSLPYRPNDLITDTDYNMKLGMIEFQTHYNSWNNSLVLAIAAYNAGPGNVRKWVAGNRDPSRGAVDAIDWIEQIPFGETRNYVQRVLENMEAYKNRLAGRDQPLTILADLYAPVPAPDVGVLNAPAAGTTARSRDK